MKRNYILKNQEGHYWGRAKLPGFEETDDEIVEPEVENPV